MSQHFCLTEEFKRELETMYLVSVDPVTGELRSFSSINGVDDTHDGQIVWLKLDWTALYNAKEERLVFGYDASELMIPAQYIGLDSHGCLKVTALDVGVRLSALEGHALSADCQEYLHH